MASFKNKKNLLQQRGEYARYFDRLRGVDFSSDHNDVEDSRFAYLVNMYRDYKSGQGGAVETIPGFRSVMGYGTVINGIHVGYNKIFIHVGSKLYLAGEISEDGKTSIYQDRIAVGELPNEKTISFFYQKHLYVLGGGAYLRVFLNGNNYECVDVSRLAYIPTTYEALDPGALKDTIHEDYGKGYEKEQRNLLTPFFKHTFIADGETREFTFKEPIDNAAWDYHNNRQSFGAVFPEDLEVYLYGIKLPLAYIVEGESYPHIPEGYPNAISYIISEGAGGYGEITLANAPPKPDKNSWNPTKGAYDYTPEEIKEGKPEADKYEWPYAFGTKYAGVEIKVKKEIKTLGGGVNQEYEQHKIISNCRIAAVFDNRLFLAGNPQFPQHIFYNHIPNDRSGVPSAAYFGQLDYVKEGASASDVVAMMNVGDSLLVLKEDGDEEDSVIIHTPQIGPSDVQPIIYPSEKGHKGIGCLGPCYNFRDDPVFLTRFGVDALGHVSTKYRRAIKHRSSMVDAKLRNLDLSEASIAEWDGYLMILVNGVIFMADSRQMYNTESGNTEYEWYYLEDIGVYEGQFDEYVYAEFPIDMQGKDMVQLTGLPLKEAKSYLDENGIVQNLIGTLAYDSAETSSGVTSEGKTFYYKELPEYDENGLEKGTLYFYVAPSGGKAGGEFDPAVLIKTVGEDLFFATSKGHLCKFNFDMRDPKTGLIPNEYYDFNGRAIFSGCATKMDNCGIPHLTKTTVKRSTVIKTRSFEASGVKVKVRTNRRAFNQIARITSGKVSLEDLDFKSYTFSTEDKNIFSINEREKKWLEKQIFIYSDEFRRPFAIHYLAYRYNIAGRYKE